MSASHPGWTSAEIEDAARIKKRTLVNWVRFGLIPSPSFRGRATRYSREHVVQILAVKKLRGEFCSVPEIKHFLATCSIAQLEALVGPSPPLIGPAGSAGSAAASAAAAPDAAPAQPAPAPARAAAAAAEPAALPAGRVEQIERIVVLPGLELLVRDDPTLKHLARIIAAQYGGKLVGG